MSDADSPTFDIFRGASDRDAQWVETVAGLGNAMDRMREIMATKPGRYLLLCRETHRIDAVLEATPQDEKPAPKAPL